MIGIIAASVLLSRLFSIIYGSIVKLSRNISIKLLEYLSDSRRIKESRWMLKQVQHDCQLLPYSPSQRRVFFAFPLIPNP